MGIWNFLTGGVVDTVGDVATEWIKKDANESEARKLFIQALDPNGKMRRDLSRFASRAYAFYLGVGSILLFMVSFGYGDAEGAKLALSSMKDLFLPITTAWGGIVSASFGVNGMNSYKNKS